jgi:hypothetical protein
MTNREQFLTEIRELINKSCIVLSDGANVYFESLETTPEKEKAPFTENGARVLLWMQENYDHYNNILKAKEIAEGMFAINGTPITSRTVSGAMRKLITDRYVEKTAGTPVCYSLTDLGKTVEVIIPEPKTKKEEADS